MIQEYDSEGQRVRQPPASIRRLGQLVSFSDPELSKGCLSGSRELRLLAFGQPPADLRKPALGRP